MSVYDTIDLINIRLRRSQAPALPTFDNPWSSSPPSSLSPPPPLDQSLHLIDAENSSVTNLSRTATPVVRTSSPVSSPRWFPSPASAMTSRVDRFNCKGQRYSTEKVSLVIKPPWHNRQFPSPNVAPRQRRQCWQGRIPHRGGRQDLGMELHGIGKIERWRAWTVC